MKCIKYKLIGLHIQTSKFPLKRNQRPKQWYLKGTRIWQFFYYFSNISPHSKGDYLVSGFNKNKSITYICSLQKIYISYLTYSVKSRYINLPHAKQQFEYMQYTAFPHTGEYMHGLLELFIKLIYKNIINACLFFFDN